MSMKTLLLRISLLLVTPLTQALAAARSTDVILKNNRIRDTRPSASRRQNTGIRLEEKVGLANLEGNAIETKVLVEDQCCEAGKDTNPVPKP
jgi:hypothetical protein